MLRAINCRAPFLREIYRSSNLLNVARCMQPYTSREDKANGIVLLRLAVCPKSEPKVFGNIDDDKSDSSSLAGKPRSILNEREEIRAEVLAKWNQRPQIDTEKEWIRYSIHY